LSVSEGCYVARISVITIVKDHSEGLELTHASLAHQSYPDWEMIIVVGPSIDGTLSIAKEKKGRDKRIFVIEQNGSGIYEAMNEGLQLASGEYIWFMNAGDIFSSEEVLAHSANLMHKSGAGVVIGGYKIETQKQNRQYVFPSRDISDLRFAFNRRAGCHQAMIFRSDTIKDLGGFNTNYTLAADFDLVIRVIQSTSAIRTSEIYTSIEPGGRADQGILLVHKQKHQIRRILLGGPFILCGSLFWTALVWGKMFLRWITGIKIHFRKNDLT
jgi:putative colanic acid biosynthesis glycosyltransferase